MMRLRIAAAILVLECFVASAAAQNKENIGSLPGRQRNSWLLSHRCPGRGRTYRRRSRTRRCAWSREPASVGGAFAYRFPMPSGASP